MPTTLISVPAEIRKMIFQQLFASTTVYIGFENSNDETSSIDGKSSIDESGSSGETISTEESSSANTSILRTCRLISIEAKPIMPSNISFHIYSTKALIDFLSTLSPELIQSIRYISLLYGFHLPLYTQLHRNSFTTYHVDQAFNLFPGLQLDLLRVEDCYHLEGCYYPGGSDPSNVGTYQAVDGLIRMDGWKELHFITPTTQFMSEPCDEHRERVAQPSEWNRFVLDRDGKDSAASVKMFVAKDPDIEGAAERPETRIDYKAIPGQLLQLEGGVHEMGTERQRYLESREVLAVAKRGVGASYVQDGRRLHKNIKSLLNRMSWEEILFDGRYLDPEDDPARKL